MADVCPQLAIPFIASWTILIVIVGIIGNVLTLAAFWKYVSFKHITNIFVINLACSDLLFCSFSAPMLAAEMLNTEADFHPWTCNVHGFIFYSSLGCSMLGLAGITLTRYLLVAFNQLLKKYYIKYIVIVYLIVNWLLPFSLFIPVMLSIWGKFQYETSTCICIVVDFNGNNPQMGTTIFGFVLPCTVHVICYSHIFWIVQKSKRNVLRHQNSKIPSGLKDDNIRITKTIFVIVCLTFSCYIPFTVVKSMLAKQIKITYPNYYLFAAVSAWTHCMLSPIIYVTLIPHFRSRYKVIILSIFHKVSSQKEVTFSSRTISTDDKNLNESEQ